MKKTNFHTHTKRCMHACGSDEDYVLAAIKSGYDVLGFSDHTPWNYETDFVAHMRMRLDQAQAYFDSIASLKEKYNDRNGVNLIAVNGMIQLVTNNKYYEHVR